MTFVHRPVLMTEEGVVVSGHHKASEVGAGVLRDGGNAIDAAVAASAALCIAVPHMNGLGGDSIALYFDAATQSTTVINGSGRAPSAASCDAIRQRGHAEMPSTGPLSISVCGLVDAWDRSLERFGTRPLSDLLKPAVRLAESGIPLDMNLKAFLSGPLYQELANDNPQLAILYGAHGSHHIGSRLCNRALANSLEAIRLEGRQALYRGHVGRALIADLAKAGALISEKDLADHETRFDQPLSVEYLGRLVHAAPPNTQGIALAVLSGLADLAAQRHGRAMPTTPVDFLKRKAIAFACRAQFAGDPEHSIRPDHLLSRQGLFDLESAPDGEPGPTERAAGDTSTIVVVDKWGNAASWVQSLFQEFGSGVTSPSTGIVMHNRLGLQSLDPGSYTPLRAGERPFHTLCPALVVKDGACEVAIATPGDHGQPQTIHQVLTRLYADGDDIQAAIEAPRIRHDSGLEVMIEDRIPEEWLKEIEAAGFTITRIGPWSRLAGGVNAIVRRTDGLMLAGADPRRACYAVTAD